MGVDFYPCVVCESIFPDCGEFCVCEHCSTIFCSEECADLKVIDPNDENNKNCQICRKEFVSDYTLLEFMLKRSNLTREQAADLWRYGEEEKV